LRPSRRFRLRVDAAELREVHRQRRGGRAAEAEEETGSPASLSTGRAAAVAIATAATMNTVQPHPPVPAQFGAERGSGKHSTRPAVFLAQARALPLFYEVAPTAGLFGCHHHHFS